VPIAAKFAASTARSTALAGATLSKLRPSSSALNRIEIFSLMLKSPCGSYPPDARPFAASVNDPEQGGDLPLKLSESMVERVIRTLKDQCVHRHCLEILQRAS
jgi:hypothetical protein